MDSPEAHASPRLRIHLLGGFSVYVDGQALADSAIKGRKARLLLKLLAYQRQYQIVREHVTDILWPELAPEAANAQLYKALHHIRKALAEYHTTSDDWIVITDDLIRLSPAGGLVTDMELFEKAARAGLKNQNIAELERACSLYSGEFLPMDRYAEWASFPREHYRQLYLDVLSALATAYEHQGELSEAAEMMRLALDKEPTLETAHRGLMGIFAKKGQATRAFHQYEMCREILRDELGLSPSAETMKTLEEVQEGKLRAKKETAASSRTSFSGPATPLIGCDGACTTIGQLLENLSRKQGAGLVIKGEAGMGKTRLVQELIQQARLKGLPFYMGQAGAGMGSMAYGAFIELFIDTLNKQPRMAGMLPPELRHLVPGFSGEGQPLPHVDQLAGKGYLFAQVYRFFSKLTSRAPAVIILEDLQSADQGSKELLSYLIQHRGRLPILFVGTLRKEAGAPLPPFLIDLQDNFVEVIELLPLSYDEHLKLLQLHAENAPIKTEMASHIYQLAEGNPFFALELLRHFREHSNRSLPEQHHNSGIIPYPPVSESLPTSVFQMVEQKLATLSPAAHHLLYIAAVIGRQVPYELLISIWKSGNMHAEQGLFNALEEVMRARLIEEHGLDYCFRHAIVQETIYASISEARRQILHKQLATRLLELSAEREEALPEAGMEAPVELVAWHYMGAKDIPEAAHYLVQAGERAEKVYAHEDALLRYSEASDLLERLEGQQVRNMRCKVLERIGDVYRACGQAENSGKAYEKAIALGGELYLKGPEQMELHRKMAVSAICRNEMGLSEKHLDKAFALAGDEPRHQARLFITKALLLWHLNRLEDAYQLAKKALEQAKKADAPAEASQACETLSMTCLPLGRWEEGLQYEQERQSYGWSPKIVVATDAHHCLGEYHIPTDQSLKGAGSFMEQVAQQLSRLGDMGGLAVDKSTGRATPPWHDHRPRAGAKLPAKPGLQKRAGSPAGMAYSQARKSVLHTLMGATAAGWQEVQEGFVYARQAAVGDHCLQRLYGVGIWNRLESGDFRQAAKLIKKSEKLMAGSESCAACTLELYPWFAYYYLQTKQPEKARSWARAVAELAKKTGNPIGKSIAVMIKSSLCITEGKPGEAAEYSRQAQRILEEEIPQTFHAPVAHFLKRMLEKQPTLVKR